MILVAAFALACGRVTPEKIESWKSTDEGIREIARVVEEPKHPVALRAQAAAALVEVGDLSRAEAAVAGIPIDERGPIVAALVPRLGALLGGGEARKAEDARDALFGLRHQATSNEAKRSIDDLLLPVIEKELRAGKASGVGRFSALQICQGLGAPSVPMLHRLLDDGAVAFGPVAEILGKVGDKAERERGGASLARRAATQATLPPLPKDLALAIGSLGGPQAVAFLEGRAELLDPAQADTAAAAAAGMVKLPREDALLPFALRLAGDPARGEGLRASLFELIERFHGEEPRKGLEGIIAKSAVGGRLDIAYRALQAALKVHGSDGGVAALEAFPASVALDPKDVKEKIVKAVIEMRFDGRAVAFKAFESKAALPLMVSVWYLDDSGFGEDHEPLDKFVKDKRTIKGFPRELSIAAEAARVSAKLRKQREQEKPPT